MSSNGYKIFGRVLITTLNTKILLSILFCLISVISYSQFDYYVPKDSVIKKPEVISRHTAGDMNLSLAPVMLTNQDFGMKLAGGIKLQIFIGKKFSVDGDLVIGNNYLHTGPGLIAIPFWLLTLSGTPMNSDDGDRLAGFLLVVTATILSVEHFSYHIPLNNNTEIAPYVSLLRFRFMSDPELSGKVNQAKNQLAFATGIQLDKYFGRFFFSPYAEYCIGYSDHIPGFNLGAGIGICFKSK